MFINPTWGLNLEYIEEVINIRAVLQHIDMKSTENDERISGHLCSLRYPYGIRFF